MNVILIGGPADIPDAARKVRLSLAGESGPAEKVKLRHGNGYEHFERPYDVPSGQSTVPLAYHWTMRTQIAE
ncbi:DUF5988 family protein [Streptomyces sp. NPDC020141]|uniref:DUF5988 family protein n=1 Tax=Streptomyces sp. NPDC020141 TaxID=3365065 RepID=UPI0037A7105D